MELMALLFGLLVIVTFFVPWVNASRIGSLRDQIEDLRRELGMLQDDVMELSFRGSKGAESAKPAEKPAALQEEVPAIYEQDSEPDDFPAERQEGETRDLAPADVSEEEEDFAARPDAVSFPFIDEKKSEATPNRFEQNWAARLPVWIGAVALVFAAFYLVKYSIEAGWLGPQVRLLLGGAFGAALLAGGQWLVKREHIPNALRMAQGLVGAGLVTLYVCLYAAVSLYGLIPPLAGFGGMTLVTALAVILSVRHGQPIAVFGLIGGLLTPALVGSQEPNALLLFSYLFALFAGMLTLLARRGWWMLAVLALLGVFAWMAFWCAVVFAAGDALVLILFAVAVCGLVLAVTAKAMLAAGEDDGASAQTPVHAMNFIAIAGASLTIIWLGFETALTLFDWSVLGLLSGGIMALAWFRPAIYQRALWPKLAADLFLLYAWLNDAASGGGGFVIAGLAVLYVAVPYLLMRRVADPRFWAGVQIVAALALYIVAYNALTLPAVFAGSHCWGITAVLLAGLSVWQTMAVHKAYRADETIRSHLLATYTLAATAFIALGLAIELPQSYLPLAFTVQAAATMWVYSRTGIAMLGRIVVWLVALFAILNLDQFTLFFDLAISSLFGDTPSGSTAALMLDRPLLQLGLPAFFTGLALYFYRRRDKGDTRTFQLLLGATVTLLLAAAYYVLRDLFHGNPDYLKVPAGFIERGSITILIAASAVALIEAGRRYEEPYAWRWGVGLFHLAMFRFGYFDLLLYNPYSDASQFVGNWPLLNGVTLTYGTGIALSAWAARSNLLGEDRPGLRKIYKLLGFALFFAFISLHVRQLFHGGYLATGVMGNAEFYSYSAAWLISALALLAYGIMRRNVTARMASLGFMLLTVVKVFLFDAGELEGLYRVFSFLGLGVSLIGLSMFYTRFVFGQAASQEES